MSGDEPKKTMQAPPEIQKILDQGKAEEIAGYIERRNTRRPDARATLSTVCTRFRINQAEAKRIIDSVDFLVLSDFAYKSVGETWAEINASAWYPQLWEDAPDGKRLVMVIKD